MDAKYMGDTHRELVRSWLAKAASDLRTAHILGSAQDAPLDTAIYHCQQAAEKAVKTFLVHCGITPEKTHDLRILTLQAAAHDPRFNGLINMAAALTPYAWEFRYPDDLAETFPTRAEFDAALQHAQAIYDFVLNLLPKEARP
jgi:HEPN domain-containing protein